MKHIFRKIVVFIALFAISGCAKKLDQSALPVGTKTGDIYYSQVALYYEKGRHLTTNYRRGIFLPINSQVVLLDINTKHIELEVLPAHSKLRIENIEKHTGDSTTQAFAKLFAKNKVELSKFTELEREKILAGKAAKGMSKKAVIAALGYPPITETPSLSANQWTYWASRFDRFLVNFENDKVSRVQD
ncbi:MAG: hypothetical protein ABL925_15665 [Methylococcales bacterium]